MKFPWYKLPIPEESESIKHYGIKLLASKELGFRLVKQSKPYKIEKHGHEFAFNKIEHFFPLLVEDVITGYMDSLEIKPGDTVLDAGSYPGEFAIYAAKKGAEVICLEPDRANLKEMREILELNEVDAKLVEKVVSDKSGKEKFKVSDSMNSKVSKDAKSEKPSVTLNELHDKYGPFDLIKMDIEGAEVKTIKKASKVLNSGASFSIASYHRIDGEKSSEILEEFFTENGYEAKTVFKQHPTTIAKPKGGLDVQR